MNKKKMIIAICLAIFMILVGIVICVMYDKNKEADVANNIEDNINVEDVYANLTDMYIYGTHLNVEGVLHIDDTIFNDISLLLKNKTQELEYDLKYQVKDNNVSFSTCEYINRGINLEEINETYTFLLKVKTIDNEQKYYSINTDKVKIADLEYYSISKNNMTNYVTFKSIDKENSSYFVIISENIEMPENIYDITIDAGHGGNDPGATYNGYNESDITLEYAESLKKELEEQGLKVKLTRFDDTRVKEYGEDGRAVIPNKVKSKYTFSIHLNSSESNKYSGVEIYAPSIADLSFAKLLADNIVTYANTNYSNNEVNKTIDGVYVRTMTEEDMEESKNAAKKAGYEPYRLTTDTPYLFMIRETGGKITNAYVDGRNTNYEKNIYYDSNIGNESYLLELGFINSDKDLNNLLNNKPGYIKGIVGSIVDLVK